MRAFISLGSNLGDRRANLEAALRRLAGLEGVRVLAVSRLYETEPEGRGDQPKFLNAVAELETTLEPAILLERLQQIEQELGRTRETRWGPRTVDLDLLLYGDRRIETPQLTVPHPRMRGRRFVLEPLAEIAGDLVLPGECRPVRELLAELPR